MKHLPTLNLILIAVSFVIIILGFALMAGEPSGEVYNHDIFSFQLRKAEGIGSSS